MLQTSTKRLFWLTEKVLFRMQKIKLIFAIFLLLCFANTCDVSVFAKPNTDLDNPKVPKKSKVSEEPDLLVPPPATPKDIKKKEKETLNNRLDFAKEKVRPYGDMFEKNKDKEKER